MADLQSPIFQDETAARETLEAVRWPDGPWCPHCGNADADTIALVKGKKQSHRPGLRYCNACKKQFTVTVGTVFERSKVPLTKWWLAVHLVGSSKKGISAHQIHRMLGVTYKTAWFMMHRIREAMRELNPDQMGGDGKTVEADETFVGGKEKNRHRSKRAKTRLGGSWGKETVFSLLEREGRVRSIHTPSVTAATLRPILVKQLHENTMLVTDDAGQYRHMHKDFDHHIVNHGAGEYVRGEAHTNSVEGYFSILKRGITGVYHHVSQQHLKRYLGEFDFRYNHRAKLGYSDKMRVDAIMAGIEGKRLTYRRTNGQAHA